MEGVGGGGRGVRGKGGGRPRVLPFVRLPRGLLKRVPLAI